MMASAQVTIGSGDMPQATLDIVGDYSTDAEKGKAFRLDDGNQGDGKVLTVVGDNGVATWQYAALRMVSSEKPADEKAFIPLAGGGNMTVCPMTITLPPGKWKVDYTGKFFRPGGADTPPTPDVPITNSDTFWILVSLSDSSNPTKETTDIAGADRFISYSYTANPYLESLGKNGNSGGVQGTPNGFWVVNNTSGAPKTYSVIMQCASASYSYPNSYIVFYSQNRENKMVATPILP
jgi:hypothetical protein